MNNSTRRHALITGAGTGIGAAIAAALHAEGFKLSLAGRRAQPLEQVKTQLGSDAAVLSGFDVADPGAVMQGIAQAREANGPIDILINNAGEAPSAPFAKTDEDLWAHVLAVNLSGVYRVTRAALADIIAQRGRIINVASTAGRTGYAYVSAYCAAKHGVVGLTRSLALELAKTGVTVNAVCPGYTDTPLVQNAVKAITDKTGRSGADVVASMVKDNPQGRLVKPEEVAAAVVWLASEAAASVNGQAIVIDGGGVIA